MPAREHEARLNEEANAFARLSRKFDKLLGSSYDYELDGPYRDRPIYCRWIQGAVRSSHDQLERERLEPIDSYIDADTRRVPRQLRNAGRV